MPRIIRGTRLRSITRPAKPRMAGPSRSTTCPLGYASRSCFATPKVS